MTSGAIPKVRSKTTRKLLENKLMTMICMLVCVEDSEWSWQTAWVIVQKHDMQMSDETGTVGICTL